MALSPKTPYRTAAGLADRVDHCFPANLADLVAAAPGRRVSTNAVGRVAVLDVKGRLGDVVEELDCAIQLALAEAPRGVACDLSAVQDGGAAGAFGVLASSGRHVRDWSGIPVVMACPDARVRDAVSAQPLGEHLLVAASLPVALSAILETTAPCVESLGLSPHPTSPRASRDFVNRTLPLWGLDDLIATACLLVSELVTNAMLHAGTDIELTLAAHAQFLRVTVRDGSASPPTQRDAGLDLHGRGLAIVASLSRAWGVLPTGQRGKVVWAVLDATQ